jgi:membrane-bound lytic murein transglycosylase B
MEHRSATWSRAGLTLLGVILLVAAGIAVGYGLGRAEIATLAGGRIPAVAYDAYRTASSLSPTITPTCEVEWTVLAGIGQIESRHGRIDDHDVTEAGDVVPAIRGRPLDGTRGTQPIADTDDGDLDGDTEWDRAVGPLQFIPTTWRELGRDANGDGAADPDNLYDAALTAVAHLCLREPGNYDDRAQLRQALIAYNASGRYADDVLTWVDRYRGGSLDEIVEAPPAAGDEDEEA